MAFLDFGALPSERSLHSYAKLHVHSMDSKRQITMVGSREAVVVVKVLRVPITVGALMTEMSFLVIRSSRYDFIIGDLP